jgi:hypothetical protein
MGLRAIVGLAALGGAVLAASFVAIDSLVPVPSDLPDVETPVVAPAATAAIKGDRVVPAAVPDAAVFDAFLLTPRPLAAPAHRPTQALALAAPEPAHRLDEVTGSIRTTPDWPEPRKTVPEPRLEKDGTLTLPQIARIKANLNLTPEQERHWAPVEAELREIARRMAADKAAGKNPKAAINADTAQRLYWAAGPLIMSLRPDQKAEARRLARAMGLEQVAALI